MFEIISQYFPLWVFITLMVSTPGPANLLLLSSGAQNGYIKSLSFLSGLVFGKLILNILFSEIRIALNFGIANKQNRIGVVHC